MAAYFIAQYQVNDPSLYQEYSAGAGPTLAAHGAELVAFDVAAETIEGTPPGPQSSKATGMNTKRLSGPDA